ncbi:MAG: nucleoside triphosphate pyrophosphohydrolase family protein [Candidatus Saccharimonadales bacterium]
MTIDEYQRKALLTAETRYESLMQNTIWAMGVAGEAGEVIEKWKKIVAYKGGKVSKKDLEELKKELGDVIWYVTVLANSLGLSLEDVMQTNLTKLADRKKRKVISGAGDNR